MIFLDTVGENDIFSQQSGRSSVVEHLVANENVESSNLFARSKTLINYLN